MHTRGDLHRAVGALEGVRWRELGERVESLDVASRAGTRQASGRHPWRPRRGPHPQPSPPPAPGLAPPARPL